MLFSENGREERTGREKENIDMRERHQKGVGHEPITQADAWTGNQTGDPLVHGLTFQPLSNTSQGYIQIFI